MDVVNPTCTKCGIVFTYDICKDQSDLDSNIENICKKCLSKSISRALFMEDSDDGSSSDNENFFAPNIKEMSFSKKDLIVLNEDSDATDSAENITLNIKEHSFSKKDLRVLNGEAKKEKISIFDAIKQFLAYLASFFRNFCCC